MAAHDDFQSDKDLPIESGGSDSSSTLLPHPWNYSRKSSRSSWGGQICNYRNWLIALNALIFITTVGLWATGTFARKSEECQCDDSWTTKFEEDLQYTSRVTFQPHSYFGGPPSNKTDEIWKRLSPPGDGIVELPIAAAKNLPESLPAPNNPETALVYGVSVFHQLHCLNFLRFAYYPSSVKDMDEEEVAFHRDHCLDYIRQVLMCHADPTFEPMSEVGINGMGAVHQCRDFNKIFSWAYEHRSNKVHGSGYTGGRLTHTPADLNDFDERPHAGHGH
ncbi:hypothetical protein CBS147332_6247 [Penicillium roqueforti]|nr:hypothetical protein CBS147332_6247 [Penicillium roqueforti]KAI3098638.1 hypothetical protein CBS147331_8712 [Penicillium roqueforti]